MKRPKIALAPKTMLKVGALVTAVVGGAIALSATSASADVACNRYHECWRVHDRTVVYPGRLGVTYHEDGWWDNGHPHHYNWRADHDGHGYWRHGAWITF